MDPYKVLKVRKNFTPGQLRKAFRKAAMATHPDRAGNREDFERVKLAHHVLSDPARKKLFDETGQIDAPKVDNNLGETLQTLGQAFAAVFNEVIKGKHDIETVDVVDSMKRFLTQRTKELEKNRPEAEKTFDMMKKARARMKKKKQFEQDLMELMLQGQEAQVKIQANAMETEIARNKKALTALEDYEYAVKVVMAQMPSTAATTGGMWVFRTA